MSADPVRRIKSLKPGRSTSEYETSHERSRGERMLEQPSGYIDLDLKTHTLCRSFSKPVFSCTEQTEYLKPNQTHVQSSHDG